MGTSPRHFTITDDWVMMHPDVSPMQFYVYTLIKGNIPHMSGGVPESGFRATAAWVEALTDGKIKKRTVGEALRRLAVLGVLRRLNDPQSGDGAEFEFVVDPGPRYKGLRSVMTKAKELDKRGLRGVYFKSVPLSGHPAGGVRNNMQASAVQVPVVHVDIIPSAPPAHEMPEGEISPVLDRIIEQGEPEIRPEREQRTSPQISDGMRQFADCLQKKTAELKDARHQLMEGVCRELAVACRPALDRGWDPEVLAGRLAAELTPRINAPKQFLLSKVSALGEPPQQTAHIKMSRITERDLDNYVPRPSVPAVPERDRGDEEEKAKLLQSYRERKLKDRRTRNFGSE